MSFLPSRHLKMPRRLQPAVSSPRRKNCLRFLPPIHCKTHRPMKNWSAILLEPTRAASISSIDWFTRYSPQSGLSVYCACGATMSERANRLAHPDSQHVTSKYGCRSGEICARGYLKYRKFNQIKEKHPQPSDFMHGYGIIPQSIFWVAGLG